MEKETFNSIYGTQIEKIKTLLGQPMMAVELNDEQIEEAILIARDEFELFKSVSKRSKEEIEKIDIRTWIFKYATAVSKEILAGIRGKFYGKVPVPGGEIEMNYESLIADATATKSLLINLLCNPNFEVEDSKDIRNKVALMYYINVGNMDGMEVMEYIKKLKSTVSLSKQYTNLIEFFIPISGEQDTKIIPINFGNVNADTEDIKNILQSVETLYKEIIESSKNIKNE